jgi:hypothetical protein
MLKQILREIFKRPVRDTKLPDRFLPPAPKKVVDNNDPDPDDDRLVVRERLRYAHLDAVLDAQDVLFEETVGIRRLD